MRLRSRFGGSRRGVIGIPREAVLAVRQLVARRQAPKLLVSERLERSASDLMPLASLASLGSTSADAVVFATLKAPTRDELHGAFAALVDGGVLAVLTPTRRNGLRGLSGMMLKLIAGSRPKTFEELCESLLVAGARQLSAKEMLDPLGWSLVWGTVSTRPRSARPEFHPSEASGP